MGSMEEEDDGREVSVEDLRAWSALAPFRGQIVECRLDHTNLSGATGWAAFLILQVSNRLDGSIVLRSKFLGCEDAGMAASLETRFNRRPNSIHLCLSTPCVDAAEDGMPSTYLHATVIRLWMFTTFAGQARYIKTPRFRVAGGWLAADGQEDRAPARRRRRTGDDEKAKVKAKAKARGKDKEPGEDEEPPPAERPGRAELRRKLKDVRERLQEPAADGREKKKKRGPRERKEPIEVDASDGYSAEPSDSVEETGLHTGMELALPPSELAKAAARGEKENRKKKSGGDLSALEAGDKGTRGPTLPGLSGQLVKQALRVAKTRKRKSGKEKKKRSATEKLSSVLNQILTGSSPAGDQEKKDQKKKRKKKRRRMLKDGTLMSYSSSSYDSSEEASQAGSSDAELEAPLRRKSKEKPGSVLAMLVGHVRDQLEQGAVTEVGSHQENLTGGVKIMTYFNLHIKGAYPTHLRELRELYHLSAVLDLIRQGEIAKGADSLAARFVAIHQSLLDGNCGMAKHLELHPLDEMSAAGASTILATRKHAKLVAKMQGIPDSQWSGYSPKGGKGGKGRADWRYGDQKGESKGENKGKGKGKRPKGGKWDSQSWNRRDWGADKEKPEEKPKA